MDYAALLKKRDQYQKSLSSIPEYTLQTYERAFEVEYTQNSTAIEGNTLTLIETKVLLEDGISAGGKKLRESRAEEGSRYEVWQIRYEA